MRKLPLLLAAVSLLAVAGGAFAKTATVTITKNGYVPNSLTIARGDTVQFMNSDTVAHQVVFKSTAGVTCTPNPLVVQPAAGGSCTFQTAGTYGYSDPNVKGNTYRGSITVTAPAESLTLTGNPLIVTFGSKATLAGILSTQAVGESIDVLAQPCGTSAATKLTAVPTTTGGAYTYAAQPLQNTAYLTKLRNASSPTVTVRVRPQVRLAKVAAHRYSLRVSAAASLAGKYASFQRYNGILHRWVAVKTVALRASSTGVAPTVISSASFRSTIKARLRIRVTLPQTQVGGCYAPGLSNTTLS
jgi:plastocyanin